MGVAVQIRKAWKLEDEIEPVGRSTEASYNGRGARDPVSLVRNVRVTCSPEAKRSETNRCWTVEGGSKAQNNQRKIHEGGSR